MPELQFTSPGAATREEITDLVRRSPSGWRLDRIDPALKDLSGVITLEAAPIRVLAHENGRLVGAAAVTEDDHASRMFDERVAQIALLAADDDRVRAELLRACCDRMAAENWSQLTFYEFDGDERPTGAAASGFEHLEDGILLARLPSVPLPTNLEGGARAGKSEAHEVPALRDLARRAAPVMECLGPETTARCRDINADALARCLQRGVVLAARRDGLPVGFAAIEPSGTTAFIRLLAVDEGSRRRGVGTSLVLSTIDWTRENGMILIVVATDGGNDAAVSLYARAGFTVIGRLRFLRRRMGGHDSALARPRADGEG